MLGGFGGQSPPHNAFHFRSEAEEIITMKIQIDSREQTPLKFVEEEGIEVFTHAMAVGDYCCILDDGSTCPVRFERKSIGDLFGTMTNGYERFKREMGRAKTMGIGIAIIVEDSFTDIATGYKYSKFDGRAMIRKCFTLHIKYPDVIIYPVIFTNSKQESAAYIKSFYEGWNKNLKRKSGTAKPKDSE